MEIVIVRHGEPQRGALGEARSDPGLSERGRQQARRAARYLAEEHFDALYASPLLRAAETASIIGRELNLEPGVRENLAEFDRNAQEYLHFEDLRANRDPRYLAFLQEDLSAWGTDVATFRKRVTDELDRIVAMHPNERVMLVSHGGVINAYISGLLGAPRMVIHAPDYTSFSRLAADRAGKRWLVSLNESPHLRGQNLGPRTAAEALAEDPAGR